MESRQTVVMLVILSVLVSNTISAILSEAESYRGSTEERIKTCPIPECKGQKGEAGPQGKTGMQGPPGHCDAMQCAKIFENRFLLQIRKRQASGTGEEVEDKGQRGEPGKDGEPGRPGSNGYPGVPGRKGFPGMHGSMGMQGPKGEPGDPGQPGIPGEDGEPGEPGVPGRTGPPGKMKPGVPGTPGVDGRNGSDGEMGKRGPPGPPIDAIPRLESELCIEDLQGVIRFDPVEKQLYFCDGTRWVCIQSFGCQQPATCSSPFGTQSIGDQWYQIFVRNITQETQDAADIVLVVDESGSMFTEHEWLLVMVPQLERVLISAGVGDGIVPNRYCLIGFGIFGNLQRAHFRRVDGQACYVAAEFPRAQRQLIAAGAREDGYEAIQFALDNVPFRESPFIAKNLLLVTDEGRTVIPEGENITQELIAEQLKKRDVLLNVIAFADYQLVNNTEKVVFGVDSLGISYILEPNGRFSTSNESVVITRAEKNTADVYVDLAISLGGAAWSLPILRESSLTRNTSLQASFTSALAEIKLREIIATIESCRRCTCVKGPGATENNARVDCAIADDGPFCRCIVANNGDATLCVEGIPEEPTEIEGTIIDRGDTLEGIERAPDFMVIDLGQ